MDQAPPAKGLGSLAGAPGKVGHRLFVIFENRLQLLLLELEEERERILRAIWLSLAAAVFGLLAGMVGTALIIVVFWVYSPIVVLTTLAVIYTVCMTVCFVKLAGLMRRWETLPATLDQLSKDRECLEKNRG